VIAWLGYEPPRTISSDVLTDGRARQAAGELRRFLTGLRRVNGSADIGLLCHSYGTVVCGAAAGGLGADGLQVDDIALYGSPGVPAGSVAALRTPARVWAGRSRGDWMAYVPHVRLFRLGFGADPVSPAFGARVFDAGSGGHGDYLRPGSVSLRNLALIALGRGSEVTHA
jgi:alpha/beta hydrolase family protein